MGQALADRHPVARHVFETADRVLGYRLSDICWRGPAEELKKTVHAQPALLTHSIAAWKLLEAEGVRPHWVAGHSLGEYSACVAAGALEFEDAVRVVHRRGELMYQAGLDRPGTMAAILGLDRTQVDDVCARSASVGVVCAANLNGPGQVVISGERAAVVRACELARSAGAKRVIPLEVSGAFTRRSWSRRGASPRHWRRCRCTMRWCRWPTSRPSRCAAAPSPRRPLGAAAGRGALGSMRRRRRRRHRVHRGRNRHGAARTAAHGGQVIPSWNVDDPPSLQATLAGLKAGTTDSGAAAPPKRRGRRPGPRPAPPLPSARGGGMSDATRRPRMRRPEARAGGPGGVRDRRCDRHRPRHRAGMAARGATVAIFSRPGGAGGGGRAARPVRRRTHSRPTSGSARVEAAFQKALGELQRVDVW